MYTSGTLDVFMYMYIYTYMYVHMYTSGTLAIGQGSHIFSE